MVAVPELSWLRLPAALAKVVSIWFETAEATGTNGRGTSKSGFHIFLNAFTYGTGKCRLYLTASYGYMVTRLNSVEIHQCQVEVKTACLM